MNRVLFKQMFQAGALDYCQLDSARLASVNEILAVYLMAKKFDIPVCPHAGGVGLCELVQHLSIFDYVAVSGTLDNRVTEYVDHLHEHFVDPCIVAHGHYVLPERPGLQRPDVRRVGGRVRVPGRRLLALAHSVGRRASMRVSLG